MVVPSGRPSLNRDHHQSVPTNSRTFAALMNQRQFQTCLLPLFALNLHPLIIQRRFRRNSFRTFVANILHNIFWWITSNNCQKILKMWENIIEDQQYHKFSDEEIIALIHSDICALLGLLELPEPLKSFRKRINSFPLQFVHQRQVSQN